MMKVVSLKAEARQSLAPGRSQGFEIRLRPKAHAPETGPMIKRWRTATLANAISEAYKEVYALSDEMQDASDNMPAQLGQRQGHAAVLLERVYGRLDDNDVPGELRDEKVTWMEWRKGKDGKLFRPARRDNVVKCLQSCVASLETLPDDEISEPKREWQWAIKVLREVHFPGRAR